MLGVTLISTIHLTLFHSMATKSCPLPHPCQYEPENKYKAFSSRFHRELANSQQLLQTLSTKQFFV